MTKFEQQRIIEIVLYILNKTGGMDYYHLFKILYFANQRSLVDWGQLMIADKFCALPHGPVPTILYSTIQGQKRCSFKNERRCLCRRLLSIIQT